MAFHSSLRDRFWAKVEKTDGCWNWTAFKDRDGYGFIGITGTPRRAHRVSLEMTGVKIPDGLCVCHKCDNPSCVRPDHLWIGTQAENQADKIAKNRLSRTPFPGEKNGFSKLTDEKVKLIRAESGTCRGVAEKYGVKKSTISNIRSRKTWRHVR